MKYQVDRPYAGSLPEIHTNGPTTVVLTTSYRKVVLLLRNATRRWATVLAALALALAGLVGATGSASATLQVTNCNSASGPGSIVDTFYVNVGGDGAHVGAIQLCTKDTYYWAYVVFYAPMPAGNWGQATLNHYRNGVKTGGVDLRFPRRQRPRGAGPDPVLDAQDPPRRRGRSLVGRR